MKKILLSLLVLLVLLSSFALATTNLINTSKGVYSEAGTTALYSGSASSTSYSLEKNEGEVGSGSYAMYTNVLFIPKDISNLTFNLEGSGYDPREGDGSSFRLLVNGNVLYSKASSTFTEIKSINISSYALTLANISFQNYRSGGSSYGYSIDFGVSSISLNDSCDTLCLYAKDVNGSIIYSFTATINGTTYSTTNGTIQTTIPKTDTTIYQTNYSASGYFSRSLNVNASTYGLYVGELYKTNSVNINVYNEANNQLITTSNTSLVFASDVASYSYNTSTGTLYIDSLVADTYTITVTNPGYSTRSYTLTIGNRTDQNLNIYLVNSTIAGTTTLITKSASGSALSSVACVMYRFINSSWTIVESKYSDVAGNAQFVYSPSTNYRFILNKEGYSEKIFYLNPITETSYTVTMDSTADFNYTYDFEGVDILYSPQRFRNNNVTNFSFVFSSVNGTLTSYGYNLTYPESSNVASGSNANGGQLTSVVNITNADYQDTVNLYYYYQTTNSGLREFNVRLPIEIESVNGTMVENIGNTYGLTLFERVLIFTMILIFIVGIASMVGNPLMGLVLGMLIMGYFVYIGFIPIVAILVSMFIGVFFIIWRGS